MKLDSRWKRKWVVGVLVGVWVLFLFWPFPRLELGVMGRGSEEAFYYPLPQDGRLRVIYEEDGQPGRIVKKFQVSRAKKGFDLLETVYKIPPRGYKELFDPQQCSWQGTSLIVKEKVKAIPTLHFVLSARKKRIIWLGEKRRIELARLFPSGTVVFLKVVRKPLPYFWWTYVYRFVK